MLSNEENELMTRVGPALLPVRCSGVTGGRWALARK